MGSMYLGGQPGIQPNPTSQIWSGLPIIPVSAEQLISTTSRALGTVCSSGPSGSRGHCCTEPQEEGIVYITLRQENTMMQMMTMRETISSVMFIYRLLVTIRATVTKKWLKSKYFNKKLHNPCVVPASPGCWPPSHSPPHIRTHTSGNREMYLLHLRHTVWVLQSFFLGHIWHLFLAPSGAAAARAMEEASRCSLASSKCSWILHRRPPTTWSRISLACWACSVGKDTGLGRTRGGEEMRGEERRGEERRGEERRGEERRGEERRWGRGLAAAIYTT